MEGTAMNMQIGPARKIGYSFLGLLAGNVAMVAGVLVYMGYQVLLRPRRGGIDSSLEMLLGAFQMEAFSGIFSFAGWLIVGIPAVLSMRAQLLARMHWIFIVLIGAILGPFALLIIFASFDHWRLDFKIFTTFNLLLILASLASTTAFVIYCTLMRRRMLL